MNQLKMHTLIFVFKVHLSDY